MKNFATILGLFLGLFILATSANAATIYVYVYNVNGSTVSGARVELYDGDWEHIATRYTNSSGMATFALLDYGYYNYEVYYSGDATEFWGSDENFYLGSPTLTRYFHRNWPYLYDHSFSPTSPNVGQQVTVNITVKNNLSYSRGVKVELWIDRNKVSPWDFHQTSSSQSVSAGGTRTFTFYMTPSSAGTYYWKAHVKSYNDGAGDYIVTDTYLWSEAFTATVPEGDLDVYVHNVNGSLVAGATVKLYDADWNYIDSDNTNSSGRADFDDLEYGTYNYEVYYDGDATEFWGSDEGFQINSSTVTRQFTRNWPYLYDHSFSPTSPNVGQQVTVNVTVKNNLSYSRSVKVELWIDRNQVSPWDFHQTSSSQSVSAGGTRTFTFYMTPSSAGTYYWKTHVKSYNDGAGDYIVTDTYLWSEAFTATVQEGDLDVYVYNVNGSAVEGATVKLYDADWNYEGSDNTNSSGRADFDDLEYGTYNYEVYYDGGDTTEFWGSDEGFQINSSNVTRYFTRDWPYLYDSAFDPDDPCVGEEVTFDLEVKNNLSYARDVKVELWVDRDKTGDWDFHQTSSLQSVDGGVTQTFTFNVPVTAVGLHYWKAWVRTWNDGTEDYIPTDTWLWTEAFTAQLADLFIDVHNIGDDLIPDARVDLYGDGWDPFIDDDNTNGSGRAEFYDQACGRYCYEVYYPGGDTTEYWGFEEDVDLALPSVTKSFTRDWPYLYDSAFDPDDPCVGEEVTFDLEVKNNLSYARDVKVELWVDRDKTGDWDFHQTSSLQSVDGGVTQTFTFNVPVTAVGLHYWKAWVRTWNDGTGDYIPTDTYPWDSGFTADWPQGGIAVLDPDPNPIESSVMQGGEFCRYYMVQDEHGQPVAGAEVHVSIASGAYIFSSSDQGVVKVCLHADQLSSVPITLGGVIDSVNGQVIEPCEFTVQILERDYERRMRFRAEYDASVFNWGVAGENAVGWALYGTESDPDTSLWHRFGALGGTFGVEAGIGVSLSINDYHSGMYGGAGIEAGSGMFQEDNYQFSYPPVGGPEYTAAPVVVMLDPLHYVPATGWLWSIAEWLILHLTDVGDALDEGYYAGYKGVDIWSGGNAEGVLGWNLLPGIEATPRIELAGDVNGSLHSKFSVSDYSADHLCGVGYELLGEISTMAQGDFDFTSWPWSEGYGVPQWLGILDQDFNISYDGNLSCKLELLSDEAGNRRILIGIREKPFGESTTQQYLIVISGDQSAIQSIMSACQNSLLLFALLSSGGVVGISLSPVEMANLLYNLFDEVSDLQNNGSDVRVEYEKYACETVDSQPVTLTLNIGLALSGSLGFEGGCFLEKNLLLERGEWIAGTAYALEKYNDDSYTDVYTDVGTVPQALLDNLVGAKGILDSAFTYYQDTILATETHFQMGESYLDIPAGALPEGTAIGAFNWNWWGNSSEAIASNLSQKEFRLRKRVKDRLQQTHELHYGFGGFHHLVPESLVATTGVPFTFAYSDTEVAEIEESALRMYLWDDSLKNWLYIGGQVNADSNWVRAEIMEFGEYTLAPVMPSFEFNLIPDSDTLPADGSATCHITSDIILNNDGTPAEDGMLFTVSTTGGEITTPDVEPTLDGIQVASSGGTIAFDVVAPEVGWVAYVYARSVIGDAAGWTRIWFTDLVAPSRPTGLSAEQVDSNAVLVTWNANNEEDILGYLLYYDTDLTPPWDGTSPYDAPSPISVGLDTSRTLYLASYKGSLYYVAVSCVDMSGNESELSDPQDFFVDVEELTDKDNLPKSFILYQSYPNPFNAVTVIEYDLPKTVMVQVYIYNILGQRVRILVDEYQSAGHKSVKWDGKDNQGREVTSGIYFYRIQAGDFVQSKKMVLMK